MIEETENNKEYIELNVYQDVYVNTNGDPEDYKLVKKDAKSKKTLWKKDITHVKQVLNDKGNNRTKRVELGIAFKESIIVEGNYKQLQQCIFDNRKNAKSIGFNFY